MKEKKIGIFDIACGVAFGLAWYDFAKALIGFYFNQPIL